MKNIMKRACAILMALAVFPVQPVMAASSDSSSGTAETPAKIEYVDFSDEAQLTGEYDDPGQMEVVSGSRTDLPAEDDIPAESDTSTGDENKTGDGNAVGPDDNTGGSDEDHREDEGCTDNSSTNEAALPESPVESDSSPEDEQDCNPSGSRENDQNNNEEASAGDSENAADSSDNSESSDSDTPDTTDSSNTPDSSNASGSSDIGPDDSGNSTEPSETPADDPCGSGGSGGSGESGETGSSEGSGESGSSGDTDNSGGSESQTNDESQTNTDNTDSSAHHDSASDGQKTVGSAYTANCKAQYDDSGGENITFFEEIIEDDSPPEWVFIQVKDRRRVAVRDTSIFSEMSESSEAAGRISKYGTIHLLSEEENGWNYVESGDVRGFIQSDELEDDSVLLSIKARDAAGQNSRDASICELGAEAESLLEPEQNPAFLYKKITYKEVQVEKEYGIVSTVTDPLNMRCGPGIDNEIIGQVPKGGLVYILENDEDSRWLYVQSGRLKGFVSENYITSGDRADAAVVSTGELNFSQAYQLTEDQVILNKAWYHTFTSVYDGSDTSDSETTSELTSDQNSIQNPSSGSDSDPETTENTSESETNNDSTETAQDGSGLSGTRKKILEIAASAVGCPYVWGGNDLYNGCDCSGFAQQVYSRVGITLPRTAAAQSVSGRRITFDELQPGDLIFYATDGYVHHVAIYAGNSKTYEAYGTDRGIVSTNAFGRDEVWACTFL